ncbi:MAG: hypothetical protein H6624_06735 [Bdellovibrionaceae bacterium]|nr:hypothetical protein [Bdellovibrionales bacterium]MCB9084021.1 hypothetical protein [Pseudobdellovibrionaceae bacterium]
MNQVFQNVTWKVLLFTGVFSLLFFSYQNCSEVGFQSTQENMVKKIGDVDHPDEELEVPAPPAGSEGSQPPPIENGGGGGDDDDGDGSEGGRWLRANCRIFGSPREEWQVSSQAQDMNVNGHLGRLVIDEVNRLSVERLFGALVVGAANETTLRNIFGIVRINSFDIPSADHMLTHMRANAVTMGEVRDLFGALCLSTHSLGSLSNALTAVKIRGWDHQGQKGHVDLIERVAGNIRLKDMDVGRIERVGGYVSVHNGHVDEIRHVRGVVKIVGSVRRLEDVLGPIHIFGPHPPEEVVNSGHLFFHQR